MSKISNIKITTVKDFPDDIILFLSGKINTEKLDKEIEMKKIVWVRIKDE